MSDGTRRDFMKKAGITGAVLLTYVTPTVETFKIADAWADEDRGRDDSDRGGWEGHDKGRRHPSKKKKMSHSPRGGGGGLEMEHGED
ncbi:MAG: hypothetical protein A2889_00715 [Nitrospinae bacterium RIFCSPLOWO2_01_FULL_39_10]|nr:MAG: hypothetical protein A2889_00715 [Nitrospinae bacterium RIFCSPLOWO2_01_FULL_39_10]